MADRFSRGFRQGTLNGLHAAAVIAERNGAPRTAAAIRELAGQVDRRDAELTAAETAAADVVTGVPATGAGR